MTGYQYRGRKVELGLDFEQVNAQIIAERDTDPRRRPARGGQPAVTLPGTCRNGHYYTPDNTYLQPDGQRRCRTCRRTAKYRYQNGSIR